MIKNKIIWIDDRIETKEDSILFCKKQCLSVKVVSSPDNMITYLSENSEDILLIIVDIMLFGIFNLESIGIKDTPTRLGYDAGWVFIEKYLRAPEYGEKYFHISYTDSYSFIKKAYKGR